MSRDIVERLRHGHESRTAELDQDGGETGKVCIGHGMGYPPPWPCLYVQAADEIERLRASHDPVGAVEIAERLNVKRRTVDQWRQRATDFPAPRWTVGGRPAWNWDEVEVWAKRTGRGA